MEEDIDESYPDCRVHGDYPQALKTVLPKSPLAYKVKTASLDLSL